jgi:hypothetical protein
MAEGILQKGNHINFEWHFAVMVTTTTRVRHPQPTPDYRLTLAIPNEEPAGAEKLARARTIRNDLLR